LNRDKVAFTTKIRKFKNQLSAFLTREEDDKMFHLAISGLLDFKLLLLLDAVLLFHPVSSSSVSKCLLWAVLVLVTPPLTDCKLDARFK